MAPVESPNQRTLRSKSNPSNAITLSDIKTLIEKNKDAILESLKDEIEKQTSLISTLVKQVEDLHKKNLNLEQKCNKLEEAMSRMTTSVLEEANDQQRRRKNLIISGVPESVTRSAEDRKAEDKSRVKTILDELIECDDNLIVHVHRMGKIVDGRNRILRVVLRDEESKQRILKTARRLKTSEIFQDIFINPDLTLAQRQEKKHLRYELKRRKDLGEDVQIRNGHVVSKSSSQNFL